MFVCAAFVVRELIYLVVGIFLVIGANSLPANAGVDEETEELERQHAQHAHQAEHTQADGATHGGAVAVEMKELPAAAANVNKRFAMARVEQTEARGDTDIRRGQLKRS